jgi:hypothetical protein
MRGLYFFAPCQVCDRARQFHASRAVTGTCGQNELTHAQHDVARASNSDHRLATGKIAVSRPTRISALQMTLECPVQTARSLESMPMTPLLKHHSIFRSQLWALRCEYQCDPATGRRSAFDIWSLSQMRMCRVFAYRYRIHMGIHYRTYFPARQRMKRGTECFLYPSFRRLPCME